MNRKDYKAKMENERGKDALQFLRKYVGKNKVIGVEEFAANACIKLDTVRAYLTRCERLTEESEQRIAFGLSLFWERMLCIYLKQEKQDCIDLLGRQMVGVNDHTFRKYQWEDCQLVVRNKAEKSLERDFLMAFGTAGKEAIKALGNRKEQDLIHIRQFCQMMRDWNDYSGNFSKAKQQKAKQQVDKN